MSFLLESLLIYVRLSLMVGLLTGAMISWHRPERRRLYLSIFYAFSVAYVMDALRFLELFPLMDERIYRSLRTCIAVSALSWVVWALVIGDIRRRR